jgi:hypothetical protein
MAEPLTVFLSSTIEDFGHVREEIATRLRARGFGVRMSERSDFPVTPGVTSHEACLEAVRDSQVFVLLVGHRFGGEYKKQNKSITWREWEEAFHHGLMMVLLVEGRVNEVAIKIFRSRRDLFRAGAQKSIRELDEKLLEEFPDRPPLIHNLPGVQRFIDEIRKGHRDNWVHLNWTGTADDAMRIVDARLSAALSAYHARQDGLRRLADRELRRAKAVHDLMQSAAIARSDVRGGHMSQKDAMQLLLDLCEDNRGALFSYRPDERYNFMLYLRDGQDLVPGPRSSHREIHRRNRKWTVGQGHAGMAVRDNALLVTGDLRQTTAWDAQSNSAQADARNYVSAISVPLYIEGNTKEPDSVFIVTSSRVDHFHEAEQADVLTASTVGRILSCI